MWLCKFSNCTARSCSALWDPITNDRLIKQENECPNDQMRELNWENRKKFQMFVEKYLLTNSLFLYFILTIFFKMIILLISFCCFWLISQWIIYIFTFRTYAMQGKYCNREKIRLWDFHVFICFEVSRIHLCYFCSDVCLYVCACVTARWITSPLYLQN